MLRTRQRAMWVLFVVGGVLGVVLLGIDERMWDEGGPGIVGFEVAWDPDYAQRILAEWGDDGRDAARLMLWLDFLYLAVYGAFWALAARAARDLAARRGWARLARIGARVWPLALVAAACDALENVALLVELGGSEGRAWPILAGSFATVKFLAIGATLAYVALVVARGLHERWPRPFRLALAAAAGLAVAALAVNIWLVERASAPAADGVPTVKTAAGEIHVRDEGRRGGPPVVLIHGFGCSLRWWDPVVPALARHHRVIRLDLLGFGASEKPRDGYSMERQADVVAEVMAALGVRRAPVIGHSMGGIVGTALVERHPERVSRLMMIGTAPDDEDQDVPLRSRLAFWPVIGHAVDTLIDDRFVREAIEGGFAPEFDPPRTLVRDPFERTTWSSLGQSGKAVGDFRDAEPVHERLADAAVPVTVLLGDQEKHTRRSVALYNGAGARTVVMQGLDHTPHVEDPERTAPLLVAFASGR